MKKNKILGFSDHRKKNKYRYLLLENGFSKNDLEVGCKILKSGYITMNAETRKFEEAFAKKLKVKHAVMVNSGSSANLLSTFAACNPLRKNRFKRGDEVIVPALCWPTSLWPLYQAGLKIKFIDVDPKTLNVDADNLISKINKKTKVITLVNILGIAANNQKIVNYARKKNIIIIEDNCEGLGAKLNNKHLGTFGDFGSYSFYYSHHITTVEGGMVVCNNDEDYELLKCIRAHGWTRYLKDKVEIENQHSDIDPRFLFVNTGYNLRPMETQGAMGIIQLKKLDEKNKNRVTNYNNISNKLLSDNRNKGYFSVPTATNNCSPAWFCMPMIMSSETCHLYKKFLSHLTQNGVENRPIVTGNFARQPVCKKFIEDSIDPATFIGAEILHKQSFFIGLPCEEMSIDRVDKLIDIIFKFDFNQ